jgi:hypothetical protein
MTASRAGSLHRDGLIGHTGASVVAETVYRRQLRPVINDGAVAMNELFPRADSYSVRIRLVRSCDKCS